MNRLTRMGFSCLLAVLGLSVLGCCDAEKRQIGELSSEYNRLQQDYQAQRDELAATQAENEDLQRRFDAGQADMATRDVEIARLQAELGEQQQHAVAPGWEPTLGGDRISVGSDVLFASGSATLTNTGREALNVIVRDLQTNYAGLPIRVYGHTDSDPIQRSSWDDNLELSAERAMAVTRHLCSAGIEPARIETVAMGEHHPIGTNTSTEGKRANRRVEIIVLR